MRRLRRLKAKSVVGRVHEMNTLYDTSDGSLARRGQMMRIRVERHVEQPAERSANRAGEDRARHLQGPARDG